MHWTGIGLKLIATATPPPLSLSLALAYVHAQLAREHRHRMDMCDVMWLLFLPTVPTYLPTYLPPAPSLLFSLQAAIRSLLFFLRYIGTAITWHPSSDVMYALLYPSATRCPLA